MGGGWAAALGIAGLLPRPGGGGGLTAQPSEPEKGLAAAAVVLTLILVPQAYIVFGLAFGAGTILGGVWAWRLDSLAG